MKAFITLHIQGACRTANAPTGKAQALSRKLKSPVRVGIDNHLQVLRSLTNL